MQEGDLWGTFSRGLADADALSLGHPQGVDQLPHAPVCHAVVERVAAVEGWAVREARCLAEHVAEPLVVAVGAELLDLAALEVRHGAHLGSVQEVPVVVVHLRQLIAHRRKDDVPLQLARLEGSSV